MSTRLWIALALTVTAAAPARAAPKYYLQIGDVIGAEGVPPEVARKLLRDEIGKHAEFAGELPDLPEDPKARAAALAARHLKGYVVTVKVLAAERTLTEGGAGKRPQLSRRVKLSVIGATIPEQQIAFGGSGESTVTADVGRTVSAAEEGSVLSDALADAIGQAVTEAAAKLAAAAKAPAPGKRRRPKR
jgi:hypothetical protein